MSSVIKEWFCGEHGSFEGSHPICPNLGCESREVIREFRTAPAFKSDGTKRTDAGLRKTVDDYRLGDLKSARPGESSKAHSRADGLLWGDDAQKFIGKPLTAAHVPAAFDVKDESGHKSRWVDPGGMRMVANEMGITQSVLPKAEITGHLKDKPAQVTK